jgi:hypothetical protein
VDEDVRVHSLAAFADHGAGAGGEPLAFLLRPGNAGSNTAAEHVEVTRLAPAQLPRRLRRRVLIRTDSGGGTHEFLAWLTGRHLHYSVGMTISDDMAEAILQLPERVWEPAYDASGQMRPGAWVAGLTGLLDLTGWPDGMRVIVRRERRTQARSCASPTLADTASPASPPTPNAASSLTWSCATAAAPTARTASAAPRTPGCVISHCTASRRTSSGANLWPWPAS